MTFNQRGACNVEENESHTLKERNKGEDTFMISMGTPAVKIADKLMNWENWVI